MIGAICVNEHGRLGRVDRQGRHRTTGRLAFFGVGLDGQAWSATDPVQLASADAARVGPMIPQAAAAPARDPAQQTMFDTGATKAAQAAERLAAQTEQRAEEIGEMVEDLLDTVLRAVGKTTKDRH